MRPTALTHAWLRVVLAKKWKGAWPVGAEHGTGNGTGNGTGGKRGLDLRFQLVMRRLAESAGHYRHFFFWVGVMLIWAASGPVTHWSNTWQLVVNTITTVYELFLGIAILVAQEYQDGMLRRLMRTQDALLGQMSKEQQRLAEDVEDITEIVVDVTNKDILRAIDRLQAKQQALYRVLQKREPEWFGDDGWPDDAQ